MLMCLHPVQVGRPNYHVAQSAAKRTAAVHRSPKARTCACMTAAMDVSSSCTRPSKQSGAVRGRCSFASAPVRSHRALSKACTRPAHAWFPSSLQAVFSPILFQTPCPEKSKIKEPNQSVYNESSEATRPASQTCLFCAPNCLHSTEHTGFNDSQNSAIDTTYCN
jgi:hypothetical protein